MKTRVLITEQQLSMLKSFITETEFHSTIVEKIKGELDAYYEPMLGVVREGGEYFEQPMIKIKVDEEVITPKALFEYMSYKHKYNPAFIKQIITDWVFGRIKDNRLTKNVPIMQ